MRYKKTVLRLALVLILGLAGAKLISLIPQPAVHWNRKVYVAFGFHGNLYHSFRGDTNDESGFGQDIRVIRHIIQTLDRFNDSGVPVRASWDFDNHFSLEDLLPRHAPDILRDIRRRVEQNRDEVLLMSYNNGLASAMTQKELADTVEWAVSNPWGSGAKDIFNTYTPVVRPQEMMTSPGNFKIYRQAGVKAVSLYYSATPFDTFRLFTRELTEEEAYNPLTYENKKTREKILIIPTYNIGDLVEQTSLSHWVERLHRMQRQGKIRRDVLVFINFDADSEYWTGAEQLKWPLNRLPNTRGLAGLIREVKDRHYVRFTTLKDYLADHGPAGTVEFRQDTADGSFDGYNSWSEKKGSTDSWTRIMAARRIHDGAEKALALLDDPGLEARIRPLMDEAYLVRLRAMSTTNFGMATPFLVPEREAVMAGMLDDLDQLGSQIRRAVELCLADRNGIPLPQGWKELSSLLMVRPGSAGPLGSRFLCLSPNRIGEALSENPEARLYLRCRDGDAFPLVPLSKMGDGRLLRFYIAGPSPAPDGRYSLCTGPVGRGGGGKASALSDDEGALLMNGDLSLAFDRSGRLDDLKWKGDSMAGPGSLYPWLRYRGVRLEPADLDVSAESGPGGTASLVFSGPWDIPGDQSVSGGSVRYRYTLVPGLPYVFVAGDIQYPTTAGTDVMKADVAGLAREMDMGWQEAAPAEFRLAGRSGRRHPVRILKTNYMDVDSSYDLNYFRHSPENLTLDSVNNHITPGLLGIRAGDTGLALGFDQSVAANFAGVPVRVVYNPETDGFAAAANPFGTYTGEQNRRPTRGNGLGHEATLISGEQFHSAAPTYNGRRSRFALMLGFFPGDRMPAGIRADLTAYANPAVVFASEKRPEYRPLPVPSPVEYSVSINDGRVTFSWTPAGGADAEYVVRMGRKPGKYPHVFRTDSHSLSLEGLTPHHPFASGRRYYAVIEAAAPGGGLPSRTGEICLDILDANHISAGPKIPWRFPLKVIWDNFKSIFF